MKTKTHQMNFDILNRMDKLIAFADTSDKEKLKTRIEAVEEVKRKLNLDLSEAQIDSDVEKKNYKIRDALYNELVKEGEVGDDKIEETKEARSEALKSWKEAQRVVSFINQKLELRKRLLKNAYAKLKKMDSEAASQLEEEASQLEEAEKEERRINNKVKALKLKINIIKNKFGPDDFLDSMLKRMDDRTLTMDDLAVLQSAIEDRRDDLEKGVEADAEDAERALDIQLVEKRMGNSEEETFRRGEKVVDVGGVKKIAKMTRADYKKYLGSIYFRLTDDQINDLFQKGIHSEKSRDAILSRAAEMQRRARERVWATRRRERREAEEANTRFREKMEAEIFPVLEAKGFAREALEEMTVDELREMVGDDAMLDEFMKAEMPAEKPLEYRPEGKIKERTWETSSGGRKNDDQAARNKALLSRAKVVSKLAKKMERDTAELENMRYANEYTNKLQPLEQFASEIKKMKESGEIKYVPEDWEKAYRTYKDPQAYAKYAGNAERRGTEIGENELLAAGLDEGEKERLRRMAEKSGGRTDEVHRYATEAAKNQSKPVLMAAVEALRGRVPGDAFSQMVAMVENGQLSSVVEASEMAKEASRQLEDFIQRFEGQLSDTDMEKIRAIAVEASIKAAKEEANRIWTANEALLDKEREEANRMGGPIAV